MDLPKNNLEAASGSKVPANKPKDSLDWFDGTMPSVDHWMDYDEDKDERNQSDTVESPPGAVTEVPPKHDRPSPTVSLTSPKNKKRKFANFDEILQNLNFDTLSLKFTKLLMFLESDKKELALPFTFKEYEEFFVIILKDINILKSKSLDASYRVICDKIIKAATGYLLTYMYEYKIEFKKIVMVLRKEKSNVVAQSLAGTYSYTWSEESLKSSSSQTSSNADTKKQNSSLNPSTSKAVTKNQSRSLTPSTVSSGFKLHCLRTMLAFIKYDETKSKQFPELSPDQALYMQSILQYSGTAFNDFERSPEVKDLHRSLWEAMKIYSLKYEFKILCEDSFAGKKNLTFEKIPKEKCSIPIFETDSNQTVNPTVDFQMSEIEKPENLKSENPKSKKSKSKNSKSEIQQPEIRMPDVAEPLFAKPEVPKLAPVLRNTRITKRMLREQIKRENETLIIKRQPNQLVVDTLNAILEFLQDGEQQKLTLVPKTVSELEFYIKIIDWCRATRVNYSLDAYGGELEKLHYLIQSQLPRVDIKASKSKKNDETTGIRKITYMKVPPRGKRFDSDTVQSTPKKKKVYLPNVLELAGTEQIQLASVVDLNQSLRHKKKNKKKKKDKLNKANAVASNWTDDSSSECSSRAPSGDRAKAQKVANNEASSMKSLPWMEDAKSGSSSRASSRDRSKASSKTRKSMKANRREDDTRKEQLIEALSVPVQSDKAMRMMRGMGWDGGALGARGVGITEPLMPKLDLPRGAGFGHTRYSLPATTAWRPKETKTTTSWVSEKPKEVEETESDVIVKKTKDLVLQNCTFDSIQNMVEQPERSGSNVELSKPNVELPTQSKSNVELSTPKPLCPDLVYSENFNRLEYLKHIYALVHSDATYKTLKYKNFIPRKARKFVTNAVRMINDRRLDYGIFQREETKIFIQIHGKCQKPPQIIVNAAFLYDYKTIQLNRTPPDFQMSTELSTPTESVVQHQPTLTLSPEPTAELITEDQIKQYIFSTSSHNTSPKLFSQLKFKVLFLLNTLNFVKSLNEEVEVTFNKVLTVKEKLYIGNVVDEVNMRIKFGSTPAETQLCSEIKKHIKDAFLGAMFNHEYTVVTLNKYYRFKRLNRPDNAVIRKSQTTVNLDIYKSETVSQAKRDVCDPDRVNNCKVIENYNLADDVAKNPDKLDENYSEDNKTAENSNDKEVLLQSSDEDIINPYDSDESSVEEYNHNNARTKVRGLSPGEERVNISKFLHFYDKEKPSTRVKNNINDDTASNTTVNINNKNIFGNGNVVIDNNDNQIIDMKRGGYCKTTDIGMEYIESDVDSDDSEYCACVEMSVDIGNEDDDEANITENERAGLNEHIDKAATNDGRLVNHQENIVIDKFDEIIDEDLLLKTDSDIEEFKSHTDCWEDIVTDEINDVRVNLCKNKDMEGQNVIMKDQNVIMEDQNVIMKDQNVILKDQNVIMKDVTEVMEVISISDEDDLIEVKEDGLVVAKINEETIINLSDDQNGKQEIKNLDIKTDCDILKEKNIVLSEENCDTQSVVFKVGTEINVPNSLQDKDSEIKTVRIVHGCHPLIKLTKKKLSEIHKQISNDIMLSLELPLLKCHGVQNDALVYTCHNKKTYDWLVNKFNLGCCLKVLDTKEVTKMQIKFICFFESSSSLYLFKMIELYNRKLSTENWVVEKTEKYSDYVIFIVKMDKFSIKFIQESGLSLFAGVDKVQFTPIWE